MILRFVGWKILYQFIKQFYKYLLFRFQKKNSAHTRRHFFV